MKAKIIVIDDEPKMTKLLRMILEDHLDCEVETYNDPHEALKRLNEQDFDLISLDHRMPGLTGMQITKSLRSIPGTNSATPILIFTGFREEAENLAVSLLNDLLFLEKPIDDARYIQNVKVGLEMKKKSNAA